MMTPSGVPVRARGPDKPHNDVMPSERIERLARDIERALKDMDAAKKRHALN